MISVLSLKAREVDVLFVFLLSTIYQIAIYVSMFDLNNVEIYVGNINCLKRQEMLRQLCPWAEGVRVIYI